MSAYVNNGGKEKDNLKKFRNTERITWEETKCNERNIELWEYPIIVEFDKKGKGKFRTIFSKKYDGSSKKGTPPKKHTIFAFCGVVFHPNLDPEDRTHKRCDLNPLS
ncbi:hypothetical protein RhiJN_27790 [Ceratobasidium sp. AG-Ba]|nr:hypothetical protein RhiJN_27790 [Ceratobasidium sp. AG-Ba]